MDVITDPRQPYLMRWSLTLQREIVKGTALTATYTGSRGVHLPIVGDVNRPPATRLPDGRWFYAADVRSGRANSRFADMADRRWEGNSWYQSLQLGLRKQFRSGLSYQVGYQLQKSMDEGSNLAGSPRDNVNSNWLASNWLDHTLDRGPSAYDIRQSLSSNWAFDLPFGRGRRYGSDLKGLVGKLVEGWQINGIMQLADGSPQNIEGGALLTCGICNNLRVSLKPGGNANPKTENPDAWFGDPTVNFEPQQPGQFGNLGRNTAMGPGFAEMDVSILKTFFLREGGAEVQFRAEFFNILNRSNFQGPVRTRAAFNSTGAPTGNFGQLTETASTSRQIQFALKVLF
jgi:hypothetical protein